MAFSRAGQVYLDPQGLTNAESLDSLTVSSSVREFESQQLLGVVWKILLLARLNYNIVGNEVSFASVVSTVVLHLEVSRTAGCT